jgi:gas vesicle protein
MATKHQELEDHNNHTVSGIFAGMLIGGMAGAVTMLLFAPQSGKNTRAKIIEKGIELRDNATDVVEEKFAQMGSGTRKLTKKGQHKAKELLEQGQAMVAEQLDHVADAAKAGKKAIQQY